MLPKASASSSSRDVSNPERDRASIGSPSPVPVPCASTHETCSDIMAASANAAQSNARCACPFGAVKLALRPSCLTQLPITRRVSRLPNPLTPSATAPQASPRT
eukprot:scaffold47921_cov652-Isochrysis_galbana.AAC.2